MDTLQAIRQRRSYRKTFTDKAVLREDLKEVLQAGIDAPSGCNMQTTQFIGVDDPELLKALADIYGHSWAATSKAAVLLLTKESMSSSGVSYHVHDYSAAAENIYLAATDKGLATVWIEGQIRGEKGAKMGALLGVPEDLTVAVYMPLGYPADEAPAIAKKGFEERAWFNRYGG